MRIGTVPAPVNMAAFGMAEESGIHTLDIRRPLQVNHWLASAALALSAMSWAHLPRQLLDALDSLPVYEMEPAPTDDAAAKGMSIGSWLMVGMLACCCWGMTNCLLHLIVMRRPMADMGGRVKRVRTVPEWQEALAAADAAGQLLVVLTGAGWHHGCRCAAKVLSQVRRELAGHQPLCYSPTPPHSRPGLFHTNCIPLYVNRRPTPIVAHASRRPTPTIATPTLATRSHTTPSHTPR